MTEFNLPANTLNAEIPPMPFGYTLSRIYRILRDHSKLFLGLGAPPAVALALLYGVMFWVMFASLRPLLTKGVTPSEVAATQFAMMRIMAPSMLIAMVPILAVAAFYLGAAFFAANKIDSGIGTSVRESFGVGWRRLGRSLGLLLWVYFRAFGLALAVFAVGFGFSFLAAPGGSNQNPSPVLFAIFPLTMMLYFAAYVYGIIVALRMSLAFAASIEEGLTAREAIARSSRLTQGSKGRIFLLLLVVDLIGVACVFFLEIVAGLVFAIGAIVIAAMHLRPTDPLFIVGAVIAGLFVACFFYVWIALLHGSLVVTLSVVYHDQRRRKDALLSVSLPATGAQLPPAGAEPA